MKNASTGDKVWFGVAFFLMLYGTSENNVCLTLLGVTSIVLVQLERVRLTIKNKN